MQFRRAKESDSKDIKSLWAYCFEKPDEAFFQWFFSKIYEHDNVVVAEEQGNIAAAVHLRPYEICLRGNSLLVDYAVGLATHPAARGNSYAFRRIFLSTVRMFFLCTPMEERNVTGVVGKGRIKTKLGEDPFIS